MNPAPIHGDQTETRGAAWGLAVGCGCRRAPAFDHSKPTAVRFSSHVLRNLGRSFGSAHFLRSGWAGDLNSIAAVRRLIAAGLDERVAALAVDADQTRAPSRVQSLSERLPSHFQKSFQSRRLVLTTMDEVKNDDVTKFS